MNPVMRFKIADFLRCFGEKSGEDGAFYPFSVFTKLDETVNAQKDDVTYITDKSSSGDVTGYKTEFPFDFHLASDNPVSMEIYMIFSRQKIGEEAKRDFFRVELFNPLINVPNVYPARYYPNASIVVSSCSGTGGEKMSCSGSITPNGDVVIGYYNTVTKEFSEELPAAEIGSLTVTSAEGSTSGKTTVTVTPALGQGNSYKYKTGANLTAPTYGQLCSSGYTNWDGTAEIEATTGNKVMIVEVNAENKAIKYGETTVSAKA